MAEINERMAELGRRAQAKLSPAERVRLARIGGLTAQRLGVAHLWTPEAARAAGRMGGIASGIARRQKAEREDRR